MIPNEVKQADVARVRWLCQAPDEDAARLCRDAQVSDAPEVHCARFALHLVRGVPLPAGYAWNVLNAPEYAAGRDAFLAPLEGHVRTMAFAAADLDGAVDPVEFLSFNNPDLQRVAIRRFGSSQAALTDDRIVELCRHESPAVRASAARMLPWRKTRVRVAVLLRLMDDPARRVRFAAELSAARTGEPELLDAVEARGNLFALNGCGDPRGRPRVEDLVYSDDTLNYEEGIAFAAKLGDRELLAHLWTHPDWYSRSNAIVAAASAGLLRPTDLDEVLTREQIDERIELMSRWPQEDSEGLLKLSESIRTSVDSVPGSDVLRAGGPAFLTLARAWIAGHPALAGAMTRLVPYDAALTVSRELMDSSEPDARRAGILAVLHRRLRECLPVVAELCLDPDEGVAQAAGDTIMRNKMSCGVYGLDTSILAAGGDLGFSIRPARCLTYMLSADLSV